MSSRVRAYTKRNGTRVGSYTKSVAKREADMKAMEARNSQDGRVRAGGSAYQNRDGLRNKNTRRSATYNVARDASNRPQ